MIKYKVNILEKLKDAGYSSYRLRQEKILAEGTLQKMRSGNSSINLSSLSPVCQNGWIRGRRSGAAGGPDGSDFGIVSAAGQRWVRSIEIAGGNFCRFHADGVACWGAQEGGRR